MALLLGHEVPRIWTRPLRELTPETSLGFEVIRFAEDVLEVSLFPWQKWWLIHALELLPSGLFRFRTVLLLVARQNGKSLLLTVLSLWRMYVDRAPLILGTAQSLDIAEEQWTNAVEVAEGVPELAELIEHVDKTNGKKALRLSTGERYKVATATRRGGRGLSGDLILLDELREHHNYDSWAAVTNTTNARPRAQIIGASNAGDAASVVLRELRDVAIAAIEDGSDADAESSMAIFEWSAPDGCGISDRAGLAAANPSLGYGTVTIAALLASARTAAKGGALEWVHRTEVLCQWKPTAGTGPFPDGAYEAGLDPASSIAEGEPIGACVDVSHDRTMAHIAVAGRRLDGRVHYEVIASRAGTDWVVDYLKARAGLFRLVAVQANGAPASSLLDDLVAAGVPVEPWSGAELGKASGRIYDLIKDAAGTHLDQPLLNVAAATAHTKPAGDSWLFDRAHSPMDCSPLVAVAGAVWVLDRNKAPAFRSAYEDDDAELQVIQ